MRKRQVGDGTNEMITCDVCSKPIDESKEFLQRVKYPSWEYEFRHIDCHKEWGEFLAPYEPEEEPELEIDPNCVEQ